MTYNEVKKNVDFKIIQYIDNSCKQNMTDALSGYAYKGYVSGQYTEIVAECFSVKHDNDLARNIIKKIEEMR